MDGLLNYLDEQIDAIRAHATAALEAFDEKAVHQARVGTRRLKAGLDLLQPLLDKTDRPLQRVGKRLRRRLGPLRDLDVMIGLLAGLKANDNITPAIAWLSKTLSDQRRDARLYDHDTGRRPAKVLGRFDVWWKLRHDLQTNLDGIAPLLTAALHERFARFAQQADWISGLATPPDEALPVDVHQVRIEGKALRYTLEMAEAGGVKLPKRMVKTFKALQESLGDWHDFVVLYERTLSLIVEEELTLHAPELAGPTLDLAKIFLNKSMTALAAFRAQWRKAGVDLAAALNESAPLISEPAAEAPPATESQTDPDPLETAPIEPSAIVPEAFEPPSPE